MQKRINITYQLMLNGYDRPAIHRYAAENWGSNERSADTLMSRARALLSEQQQQTRDNALALELAQRNLIYRRAIDESKWAIALQAADSRAKLLGLFDKPKEMPILVAVNTLLKEGILPPAIARLIAEGIQELEDRLRCLND